MRFIKFSTLTLRRNTLRGKGIVTALAFRWPQNGQLLR